MQNNHHAVNVKVCIFYLCYRSSLEEGPSKNPSSGYYLVFHTCLMALLKVCLTCLSRSCEVTLSLNGTSVTATTTCRNNACSKREQQIWTSQPTVGRKPKGNVDLAAAILFTGASPTATLRLLEIMEVHTFVDRAFYEYQAAYLLPAVTMASIPLSSLHEA